MNGEPIGYSTSCKLVNPPPPPPQEGRIATSVSVLARFKSFLHVLVTEVSLDADPPLMQTPLPRMQTTPVNRQTGVKTLPCPKLRLRLVINQLQENKVNYRTEIVWKIVSITFK